MEVKLKITRDTDNSYPKDSLLVSIDLSSDEVQIYYSDSPRKVSVDRAELKQLLNLL
jgi:hypothetical protein